MPAGRRKRTVGVCKPCRQDKVKCDSESTTPAPCTRCRTRGSQCVIDSSFHRVPTRQRIKAITDELEQLRESRGSTSSAGPDPGPRASGAREHSFLNATHVLRDSSHASGSHVLGAHSFDAEDIFKRFAIFVDRFHPRMPLMELPISTSSIYRHSPFLFWTIFAISCRIYPLPDHKRATVYSEYVNLLRSTALAVPLSLPTIQALLLLCTWPLPVTDPFVDPSWLHYSIAVGAGSYLKLNRASELVPQAGPKLTTVDATRMSNTWLAIFCISSTFSTWFGFDTLHRHAADLAIIESLVNDQALQPQIRAWAAIGRVAAKHSGVGIDRVDLLSLEGLVDISNAELDEIGQKHSASWSEQLEMLTQATKLSLLPPLFVTASKTGTSTTSTLEADTMIARQAVFASSLAAQVVKSFDMVVKNGSSPASLLTPHQSFLTLPKTCFYMLMWTCFFLMRFIVTNPACREAERTSSRRTLENARDTLLRCCGCARGLHCRCIYAELRLSAILELLIKQEEAAQALGQRIDGSQSILRDTAHQLNVLRGRSTRKTDFLDLIDPAREELATAPAGHPSSESFDFDGMDMDINLLMQEFLADPFVGTFS